MPVYTYRCDACSKEFDVTQSIHETPLEQCPDCGANVKRILSGGHGIFIMSSRPEPVRTHCGKTQTCCGSSVICKTPSCDTR